MSPAGAAGEGRAALPARAGSPGGSIVPPRPDRPVRQARPLASRSEIALEEAGGGVEMRAPLPSPSFGVARNAKARSSTVLCADRVSRWRDRCPSRFMELAWVRRAAPRRSSKGSRAFSRRTFSDRTVPLAAVFGGPSRASLLACAESFQLLDGGRSPAAALPCWSRLPSAVLHTPCLHLRRSGDPPVLPCCHRSGVSVVSRHSAVAVTASLAAKPERKAVLRPSGPQ